VIPGHGEYGLFIWVDVAGLSRLQTLSWSNVTPTDLSTPVRRHFPLRGRGHITGRGNTRAALQDRLNQFRDMARYWDPDVARAGPRHPMSN
jgi:hypothetical protein